MPSLDSVIFDTSGMVFKGEHDQVRGWHTSAGDVIELHYFAIKPDIDVDLQSLDAVRKFFRTVAKAGAAAIIEVDTLAADACIAVRQILKVPQQPHGMTYRGSIILPFQEFSFVVKVQCEERGLTGIRDSVVGAEAMADGRVTIDPERGKMRGWMQDPYDSSLCEGLHRNLSEAAEYDARFPNHPLSRLRSILMHLQLSIRIDDELRRSAPYVYPAFRSTRATIRERLHGAQPE